jgi:hypothetical protein
MISRSIAGSIAEGTEGTGCTADRTGEQREARAV